MYELIWPTADCVGTYGAPGAGRTIMVNGVWLFALPEHVTVIVGTYMPASVPAPDMFPDESITKPGAIAAVVESVKP